MQWNNNGDKETFWSQS